MLRHTFSPVERPSISGAQPGVPVRGFPPLVASVRLSVDTCSIFCGRVTVAGTLAENHAGRRAVPPQSRRDWVLTLEAPASSRPCHYGKEHGAGLLLPRSRRGFQIDFHDLPLPDVDPILPQGAGGRPREHLTIRRELASMAWAAEASLRLIPHHPASKVRACAVHCANIHSHLVHTANDPQSMGGRKSAVNGTWRKFVHSAGYETNTTPQPRIGKEKPHAS